MSRYNPTTPDALYGELQPEAMTAGMKGALFGPETIAAMMPTEGMSQTERDQIMRGLQTELIPMQDAYEAAQARRDKQEMDRQRFMMAQESHRAALRASQISFDKSKFDLEKSIKDAKMESSIAERMPVVVSQLDAIDKDPSLNPFEKSSQAARLQGQYASEIARVPALGNLFKSYQTSIGAQKAQESQEFSRAFQFGQQGYGPDTTITDFASGQKAKKDAALAQAGRDNQIKYLTEETQYFDTLQKRIDNLDTMYAAADTAASFAGEAAGQYGDDAPKVDRTKPKIYTEEAKNEAIFLAQEIARQGNRTPEETQALTAQATDMSTFIPLLRRELLNLRGVNLDRYGVLTGAIASGDNAPTATTSVGSWGE